MPKYSQEILTRLGWSQYFLRNLGREAKALAQETCPVKSGELRDSIDVVISGTMATVTASADHATVIEEGREAVAGGSYTGKWKRHKRRTKNGTTTVRGHTKTFENKKPVEITGATNPRTQEWRTLGPSAAREGTHFLANAVDAAIEKVINRLGR